MSLVLLSRTVKLRYMEELLRYLESYVNEVICDPRRVWEIAGRLVGDPNFTYLSLLSVYEMLHVFGDEPEEPVKLALKGREELREKLQALGLDVSEYLDLVLEHDVFKLKLLLNNPAKFFEILYYMYRYDELINYNKIYIATILLLIAMQEINNKAKLKMIVDEFVKYAEELDAYTATFEYIVMDHGPEEQEIDGIAETDEEIRQILGLNQ